MFGRRLDDTLVKYPGIYEKCNLIGVGGVGRFLRSHERWHGHDFQTADLRSTSEQLFYIIGILDERADLVQN